MIKDVIESIITAARKLFMNWGALLISFVLYVALGNVLYLFFTTREARQFQVVLSLAILPLAAVALFFTWQAMGVSYVRIGVGAGYLLKRALRDSWRLLLISLPLIAIGAAIHYFIPHQDPEWMPHRIEKFVSVVSVLWYLLFCLILPLTAIHFWIAAAREGLTSAIKGVGRNFLRALSPRSVLIYVLVVAIFGAIAWFLFFIRTPVQSEWGELSLFGARLSLALVAIFLGWMITLGAMAEMTARRALNEMEV